jgi:hypothetical protein
LANRELPSLAVRMETSRAATIDIPPIMQIEPQCRADWCWAAVTISLVRLFGRPGPATQCEVAYAELSAAATGVKRAQCCDGRCGASIAGPCSIAFDLATSLSHAGVLQQTLPELPPVEAIVQELDRGQPICGRIRWQPGTGALDHYIAIVGIRVGPTADAVQLDVSDPLFTPSHPSLEGLRFNYGGKGGRWVESYLTRR